jgi:hypothetical protein
MDIANRFADGEDGVTTRGCDCQKTIGETGTIAKEEDPATMTITAPIAKLPQDTRTIIIKEMTLGAQDTAATVGKTPVATKDSNQRG